jgi:hypothetical protein
MSVGLDSLAAVEFANSVSDELGMALSAIALFDHPTLDSIASHLASELAGVGTPGGTGRVIRSARRSGVACESSQAR